MVSRVYVEKKPGFDGEAQALAHELRDILGIERLRGLRLVNRYDAEGISDELFEQCVPTVFSEPQSDVATFEMPDARGAAVFAVEYLPGQFDQRADSASECIQLISQGERPEVRSATVYLLEGDLSDEDVAAIKHYVINPIEAREASLEARATLRTDYAEPAMVETVDGFLELDEAGLAAFVSDRGLAMDLADLAFCQQYFAEEGRCPTHHRDQDDRHVLVRPLPPHHVRHRVGRRADRGRGRARGLRALSGDAPRAGPRREARVPHGHGHHWGALAEGAGHPDRSGRVRGDQRLHREGEGGRGRGRSGLAVPVQERDAQPSHRDRALRRRGHLRGRRHPRPLERAQLRVPGHAPHRRGRPAACPCPRRCPASCRNASW